MKKLIAIALLLAATPAYAQKPALKAPRQRPTTRQTWGQAQPARGPIVY